MAVIQVSQKEFDQLLHEIKQDKRSRAEKMPTEKDAIKLIFEAYLRLKELGWQDMTYAPRDGSTFSIIEAGSTGIHPCFDFGQGSGDWMSPADGDLYHIRPMMFKPAPPASGA